MEKNEYEKRTKRITFAMPKSLYIQVMAKLPYTGHTNLSELLRELLREWIEKDVITIKVEGGNT